MRNLAATILACTILIQAPAMAAGGAGEPLRNVIGQPIYDLENAYVGTATRIADDMGVKVVIIAKNTAPNDAPYSIVASVQGLGPRSGGGWLLALTYRSVSVLPRYLPGQPLPNMLAE